MWRKICKGFDTPYTGPLLIRALGVFSITVAEEVVQAFLRSQPHPRPMSCPVLALGSWNITLSGWEYRFSFLVLAALPQKRYCWHKKGSGNRHVAIVRSSYKLTMKLHPEFINDFKKCNRKSMLPQCNKMRFLAGNELQWKPFPNLVKSPWRFQFLN